MISKDKDFSIAVTDRMVDLFEDEELNGESLTAAASSALDASPDIQDDDMQEEEIVENDLRQDDDMEEGSCLDNDMEVGDLESSPVVADNTAFDAEKAESNESMDALIETEEHVKPDHETSDVVAATKDHDAEQQIDYNELQRFQLRTKVLGLSIPTFTTELWRYLQMTGWTYVGGSYRPPKEQRGVHSDPQVLAKRIYNDVGGTTAMMQSNEADDSDSEEGPEIFDSANAIIDYLDQYCLPDYSLTPFQVQKERERLANNSHAYERRCKRLRYELLEIAYKERSRQQGQLTTTDGGLKSKYGHNHRPCEVCFEGASPMYPRVACRDCGLVVHTNCYGLSDYGQGKSRISNKPQNGREVDAKGMFQCQVCQVGLNQGSISKKTLWSAPQEARWRAYSHPAAICALCDYQFIAGGMVQIIHEKSEIRASTSGAKRRRSRENQLETWVHIYCYNALTGKGYKQMTQNVEDVVDQIGKHSSSTHNCCYCPRDKGCVLACKKNCGNYFHPICLQLEQAKRRVINGKANTCDQCSSSRGNETSLDHSCPDSANSSLGPSHITAKPEIPQTAGHVQYFQQTRKKKTPKDRDEGAQSKDSITVPPIRKSIAEARKLYSAEKSEHEINLVVSQYSSQFREWAFSLSTGQSILLYGFGSKKELLESFGATLAEEGNVVAINGYDAAANLTEFFDIMIQMVCSEDASVPFQTSTDSTNENETRREWASKATFIAENYSEERPLFLLIHNIDGEKLSSHYAQEALATLTANSEKGGVPMIRIAASIDDINRSMFWDPQTEHKFNWVWKLTHTYCPHFEEFELGPSKETHSKKTRKVRNNNKVMSVKSVLLSLAPKHKEVVVLLANMQSRNDIITYAALKEALIKALIVSEDSTIRAILKELRDHQIVQRGTVGEGRDEQEAVFIPSDEMMHEILAFGVN
jgi:origin recognition complex subunit 2